MFLAWLEIPKFAQRRYWTQANFGIATLDGLYADAGRLGSV
jgi:hypothetical protein